jgi:hypothetical protein
MSNTYTWLVDSLDCIPSQDGQTNVVSNVHWRVNGTDGTHNASVYGTQPLTYTAGSPFTAYSGLTESIVLGWLQSAMGDLGVSTIQSNLDNQIANLTNPPIITPALPWKNK